ncbi:PBAN-type neuropeptides-like [Uranotaenia lowii]|uniref:PBAN-type neuropeptides-like n=1 Tax=Uranotaenia lowii TaxID=190385 RepID=UPI00247A0310|nr:PBAN-type neuropeptides-like [Uranotaenia lowii]
MPKLYLFFNIVCLYLAIRSALTAEIPDSNEQKMSSFSGGDDDGIGKRAAAMWFGPRLGKRTIPLELHDEALEQIDSNPPYFAGDSSSLLASDIAQGSPYVVLLVTGRVLDRPSRPVFYHVTPDRLGRRDASANENHSRPPFAPRLGRNLPFSPRLGRSFGGSSERFGF